MQRCRASLLSVVMPPKVNLALTAEDHPSWRGNIEEGHAETLGSLQKNPKVKDGERAILYSSWRKSIARMGFSWTYHIQSYFRGSSREVTTFLSSYCHLAWIWGHPSTMTLLCLKGYFLSSALGILQVALCFAFQQGLHRIAQIDLASALNAVNYEWPLTCFIPKGNWGWSPRGFPGPSLDDKIGVIPCVTERLHLLYTLLESYARGCFIVCPCGICSTLVLKFYIFVCLLVCF